MEKPEGFMGKCRIFKIRFLLDKSLGEVDNVNFYKN